MGFDIDAWTVRVLEQGLPPLPARLEPSQTVPIALWRGERYGAVLFVRLWRNGNVDSDCAITERAADGSWEEDVFAGGSGWIQDPLVRSENGWDGDPVIWLGTTGMGFGVEPEDETDEPGMHPVIVKVPAGLSEDESRALVEAHAQREREARQALWDQFDVRAIVGAASARVAAIEVEQGGRKWEVPIESPCGAFIVGLEQPGPATLGVLGHDGSHLVPISRA